jgi:hypothetical protein
METGMDIIRRNPESGSTFFPEFEFEFLFP